MEFFNKLGQKASEAYKVTADKTSKVAKEAKLKIKIGDLKSKINDVYKEIGECVYQKHIREEDYDISNELDEQCTKIDVMSDEIETYLKQCLELKDKKQCSKCFTEIEKNFSFCPNCGKKQDDEESVKEIEIIEKDNNQKSNLEKTVEVESDIE